MGFYRQIGPIHLKTKHLLKPLKTRKFSAKYFFVENARVLRAFGCFEKPSALTIFIIIWLFYLWVELSFVLLVALSVLMPQDYSKAATHTKTCRTPFLKKSRSKLSCLAIVAKKRLRYMKKAVTTTSTAANSCHFFYAQKLKTT